MRLVPTGRRGFGSCNEFVFYFAVALPFARNTRREKTLAVAMRDKPQVFHQIRRLRRLAA
jgi:hypothetical protein